MMKVFVTHDTQGVISSIGLSVGSRRSIGIKASAGHQVSAVEIQDVAHAGQLAHYMVNHRIDQSEGRPRLVKK